MWWLKQLLWFWPCLLLLVRPCPLYPFFQQMVQGSQHCGQPWQEPRVIVQHTKIGLELFDVRGARHLLYCCHFLKHQLNAVPVDLQSKVHDLSGHENTFSSRVWPQPPSAVVEQYVVSEGALSASSLTQECHQCTRTHRVCLVASFPLSSGKCLAPKIRHRVIWCKGATLDEYLLP